MKSSQIVKHYQGSGTYDGPAIKLGAGMAGYDAEMAVGPAGYQIVAGDCPTVGITGGYTQGGGHSLLNGAYGMAADQVLEWEAVTADGKHLTATATENEDLYWALSGGGGGTFAVALGMTVKIYPESRIGSAAFSFNSTSSPSNSSYSAAVQAWWQFLPSLVDTGATVLFAVESSKFFLETFTAPNKTADQVSRMFGPYLSQLDKLSVKYTFKPSVSPTYYQHYNATNGPLPYGNYPVTMLFNSRLIPRAISEDAQRAKNLTAIMQSAVDYDPPAGWRFGCSALNVKQTPHPDNAVVPYWRDAIAICINIALWDWTIPRSEMLARKSYMARVVAPAMEAATPDSGAYLNEADPYVYEGSLKWQNAFYGTNYPRLRQIKDKVDPQSVFYANTAVGSEDWTEDGSGRLRRI